MQVVTEYNDAELEQILELTERMQHHLTAAIVSNDMHFVNKVRCRPAQPCRVLAACVRGSLLLPAWASATEP